MKWILITLLLFGSVNALWRSHQWLLSVPDPSHLAALERGITAMQGEIEKAESALQPLATMLSKNKEEMAALATEIKFIESTHPEDRVPPSLYKDYTAKVARYNQLAEESNPSFIKYQTLYKDYIVKLSRYNSLAEEGINLAQKHHRIWVFAPRGTDFLP